MRFWRFVFCKGARDHNDSSGGNAVTDTAKDVGEAAGDWARSATIDNVKEETKRSVNELFKKMFK
ncbi:MAG: hypothetical protein LBN32_02155 [Helicobacteraceae bacterium]|nr:hypothetical protein [Helicobacteraceae bacterium]